MSSNENIDVPKSENNIENLDVVESENKKFLDALTEKMSQLLIKHENLGKDILEIKDMIQLYSGSIHTALLKTTCSIEVIQNSINTGGITINNKNSSNNNNSSAVSNNGSGSGVATIIKSNRKALSINVLFSCIWRLLFTDESINDVCGDVDLKEIIKNYEDKNQLNLTSILSYDNLTDDQRKSYDDSINSIKKEADKTSKKKANIMWSIIKNDKDKFEKFKSFQNYYKETFNNQS